MSAKVVKCNNQKIDIHINTFSFLKMFLRGITNLSFMVKLYEEIAQAAINERIGIEMDNGDMVIAVRTSAHKAKIISAYNKYRADENIGNRVETLAHTLFSMTMPKSSLTAKAISTVLDKKHYLC